MPKVTIPDTKSPKSTLQTEKWYLIYDPSQRLVLCLGALPVWNRPSADGTMIYDPVKNTIENVPEGKVLPVEEVEVEIKVI